MIRVYTQDNSLPDFPTFSSMDAAIKYAKENTYCFKNGETIAFVDYETGRAEFWIARFEMRLSKT